MTQQQQRDMFDVENADAEFIEILKSGFVTTGLDIDRMERRGYDAQDEARRRWEQLLHDYDPIARGLRSKDDLPDDRHRIRREP